MALERIEKSLFSHLLHKRVISIGTNYYATNDLEKEYVSLINMTKTMLVEIQPAEINSKSIFQNLERELDQRDIPLNRKFIEIKPAENTVNEYALLSNIIMGSDRYLYIELFENSPVIDMFTQMVEVVGGKIIEKSRTELVAHMPSKKESIRIAIQMISLGMKKGVNVRAAVGMTGAASIERAIEMNAVIHQTSGVGFTKLGGEYGVIFETVPTNEKVKLEPVEVDNFMYIDAKDSTGFIEKHGKDKLIEIMNDINAYIANESEGKIEGYRVGGDDLIINFPNKSIALKTGLDCAWYAMNNGLNLRVGIGNSRREAGENAHITDYVKIRDPTPVIVFDLANGKYAYYIPTEFTRSAIDYISSSKMTLFAIFIFVFLATLIGWNTGNPWLGVIATIIALIIIVIRE
ncbi:hypothetical protein [Methanosphaera cuniculi]|uniref:Uncharacterized protein n=1 Tax=Methanosphaera cuniculi TaxID=1077256 RepID=A0A2A2HC64_9EURY|nr:hypothetical protein [Methanosphaera cuniculi]PAV06948.1 hypothetical protein ASJ82_07505 [Methanosphaera cuniculi]PWL08720.1 hypothetical protein MSCUN_04330 [Methanosphaera cuniculi]